MLTKVVCECVWLYVDPSYGDVSKQGASQIQTLKLLKVHIRILSCFCYITHCILAISKNQLEYFQYQFGADVSLWITFWLCVTVCGYSSSGMPLLNIEECPIFSNEYCKCGCLVQTNARKSGSLSTSENETSFPDAARQTKSKWVQPWNDISMSSW